MGCKRTITGCDQWPSTTGDCCVEHEMVHIGQLRQSGSPFCTLTKNTNGKDCCTSTNGQCSYSSDYPGMSRADIECPGYAASYDCCLKKLKQGGWTEQQKCDLFVCLWLSYYGLNSPAYTCSPGMRDERPFPEWPPNCTPPSSPPQGGGI